MVCDHGPRDRIEAGFNREIQFWVVAGKDHCVPECGGAAWLVVCRMHHWRIGLERRFGSIAGPRSRYYRCRRSLF